MPPPSTRSSSSTPVGLALVTFESICEMGAAAVLGSMALRPTGDAAVAADPATSSTVPHAPHSGHLPTHLATSYRQSEHRKIDLVLATGAPYVPPPTSGLDRY